MAEALEAALELGDLETLPSSLKPQVPQVNVPETLAGYQIESACIADYEGLVAPEVFS